MWDDGERLFSRGRRPSEGAPRNVLLAWPAAEYPLPASLDRVVHEFGLKGELDGAWAVRRLELVREGGRTTLMLEDLGGEPLARLLGAPIAIDHVLQFAVSIATALGRLLQPDAPS